jgi:hypothetical protein
MPPHTHAADSTNGLLGAFTRAAHWIWERRGTAKTLGFPFSEETITETILLDIATEAPKEIQVLPLNKKAEAHVGADWEWVFFNSAQNEFLRWLVQAKVLDNKDQQYAHIDRYVGNTGERQIDRLLYTAQHRQIPAMYAFYNHLNDIGRLPRSSCSCAQCHACWGCSIALGLSVAGNLPDKSFDKLAPLSVPLVCALCPPASTSMQGQSAPRRAATALHTLATNHRHRFGEVPANLSGPSDQYLRHDPPDYFRSIWRTTEFSEDDLIALAARNPGVDGLLLITDA